MQNYNNYSIKRLESIIKTKFMVIRMKKVRIQKELESIEFVKSQISNLKAEIKSRGV